MTLDDILDRWTKAKELVDQQAADDALWFIPDTVVEAYFQQELRRLHSAIEGVPNAERRT